MLAFDPANQNAEVPFFTDEEVIAKKPPVDPATLTHKQIRQGEFWRAIPAYKDVDEQTFLSHLWQGKNSITTVDKLLETIQELVGPEFIEDAREGFKRAPM